MDEFEDLKERIHDFSVERDWDQFHNGKDLAMALSIEANELLEVFLWKNPENVDMEHLREELADVFNYGFLIAHRYGLDVKEIILDKMKRNAEKYPIEKSKGTAKKYTEFFNSTN